MVVEPFDEQRLVRGGARRLAWAEFGDPGGHPLIHCHGLPGSRYEAGLLAHTARQQGLRVLCPDRPGYGHTDPMDVRSLGEEVGDIQALTDYLGLTRFDVLGFSGGGPHALAIAARLPDRVRKLTLVSSWAPFNQTGLEGMDKELQTLWSLGRSDFATFRETLTAAVTHAGGAWSMMTGTAPEDDLAILKSDAVCEGYQRSLDESTRQDCSGMIADAHALVQPWPFPVNAIKARTIIRHGEQDRNAPATMGRWLARHLHQSDYEEWPGAAHFAAFRRWPEILERLQG